LQPREEEPRDEGLRAVVGEHAAHLPLDGSRRVQSIVLCLLRKKASGEPFHRMAASRLPTPRLSLVARDFTPVARSRSIDASTASYVTRSGRGAPTGGMAPA